MRSFLFVVLLVVTVGLQIGWEGHDIRSFLDSLSMKTTTTINHGEEDNNRQYHHDHIVHPLIPKSLINKYRNETRLARRYLVEGAPPHVECEPQRKKGDTCVYRDVMVSLPIQPPFFEQILEKTMVNPAITYPDGNCVVYGMGIDDYSEWEQQMTQYCHEVHAFDCTVELDSPAVAGHNFTFHQTCIGSRTDIDDVPEYGHNNRKLEFKSLSTVMKELGHDHIDVLKFDIEGSEHELFEKEIFRRAKAGLSLPGQLLFELHSEKANPDFVPPSSVKGINRAAVNNLMLRLHDIGYRIVGKILNVGDGSCADFGMALVQED